ncbi:hypothetical protein B0H42_003580 [Clostridium saccharobutylicum]|nr:hypothetical protein [Clostridium saccharobutylicum]
MSEKKLNKSDIIKMFIRSNFYWDHITLKECKQ